MNISEKIGNSHFFIYYANLVTLEIWISFLPYDYTYEPENIYICSGEDNCSNFVIRVNTCLMPCRWQVRNTRSVNVECTGVNKKSIQTRMFFKMSVKIHSSLSFKKHLSVLLYFVFQRNDVTSSDVRYIPLVPQCVLKGF